MREKIRTTSPVIRTVIVRVDTPFHSFNKIPHTLLKVTFKAINIHHEKASSTGLSVRKLLPISKPKNCIYHSTPAKAQNISYFPIHCFWHNHSWFCWLYFVADSKPH